VCGVPDGEELRGRVASVGESATGGRAIMRHGSRELVYLQEVDLGERPAILRRYFECASGARSHIPVDRRLSVEEFENIADQYPAFPVMPEQARCGSMPRSGLLSWRDGVSDSSDGG
jgi:hypothetical protein